MDNIIKYEVGQNAIQHLIAISDDLELSYYYLKSKTKSEIVKTWIEDKQKHINIFKTKSFTLLNTLKMEDRKKPNLNIKLHYLWFNIKCLFFEKEEQIIKECLKLDAYFLNEVNKQIKTGILSKPTYTLLSTLKHNLLTTKQEFYLSNLKLS